MHLQAAVELVHGRVQLPTLPAVVARINALVDDPEIGVREIAAVVSEDAPTAAQILRIANSAHFGLREKVLSTEHAVAVLGIGMLRVVALQASVLREYEHLVGASEFDVEALWRHSILTGRLSAALAKRSRARVGLAPEELHVVGLVHDLGKVLLLDGLRDDFLCAVRDARKGAASEVECERNVLGFDHAQLGALLAAHWGLPASSVDAIERHHDLASLPDSDPVAVIVALANAVAEAVEADPKNEACPLGETALRALRLRPQDAVAVADLARGLLPQIEL